MHQQKHPQASVEFFPFYMTISNSNAFVSIFGMCIVCVCALCARHNMLHIVCVYTAFFPLLLIVCILPRKDEDLRIGTSTQAEREEIKKNHHEFSSHIHTYAGEWMLSIWQKTNKPRYCNISGRKALFDHQNCCLPLVAILKLWTFPKIFSHRIALGYLSLSLPVEFLYTPSSRDAMFCWTMPIATYSYDFFFSSAGQHFYIF